MAELKKIAFKAGEWNPVWNIVEERECDSNPGKYSLRHPNGALHSDLKGFDNRISLYDAAQEEGFNILRVGNQTEQRIRHAK